MDLVNQFIENYRKKYTFYENAGRLAAKQLETALQSAGIRAIVTSRAKNPGRLKYKTFHRNAERETPYKNMREIYDDMFDLAGVRVSLYFPGDPRQGRRPYQRPVYRDGEKTVPGAVQDAHL